MGRKSLSVRARTVTLLCAVLMSATLFFQSAPVYGATTNTGISISPTRQQYTVDAGHSATGQAIVGNLTDQPVDVTIKVNRFFLQQNADSYGFSATNDGIVSVDQSQFTLAAHAKRAVNYTISIPKNAASDAYYYALLANTSVSDGGVKSSIQVASLLYINAAGDTVHRNLEVNNVSAPHVLVGSLLKFNYTAENAGNIYEGGYFQGKLHGAFGTSSSATETHILMAGTSLQLAQSLAMPLWPGIYQLDVQATSTETGQVVTHTTRVVYLPIWAIAGIIGLIGLLFFWISALRARHRKQKQA